MNIDGLVGMFADFYADFDRKKAEEMLKQLNLREKRPVKKHYQKVIKKKCS